MRHVLIVAPGWVGDQESEDILRQNLPSLARLSEIGRISRVAPDPVSETPEALVLGLPPDIVRLRQGPLTVSALGADPPERSTHFHLSLRECSDGVIRDSEMVPKPEELRAILEISKKLNSKVLTLVPGEERDHALVWEGLGDMATQSPRDSVDKTLRSVLPEGDAEVILRRYIDDSINLLSSLELNAIRAEEGLPQLNLLWPWGQGTRTRVPNLALKRGTPSYVVSSSLRMQGLARLVGYRHADRLKLRKGINLDLVAIAKAIGKESSTIVYITTFLELERPAGVEDAAWFTERIDQELLAPIVDRMPDEPIRLTLVAPAVGSVGLALQVDSTTLLSSAVPFDSRALDDLRLPLVTSWEAVQENLGT